MKRHASLVVSNVVLFTVLQLVFCNAFASSWNILMSAYNDDVMFFVDADSVVRQAGSVTVWIKIMQTTKADAKGAWANAMRTTFYCNPRQYRAIASMSYDKAGSIMSSDSSQSSNLEIAPDTLLEEVMKTVCDPTFPKPNPGRYFPAKDNSPAKQTEDFVTWKDKKKASPAVP